MVVSKLLVGEIVEHNSEQNAYACRSLLTTIQRSFKAANDINAQFSSKVTFEDGAGSALSYETCLVAIADMMTQIEGLENSK